MTDTGVVVLVFIAVAAAVPGAVTVYVLKRHQGALRDQIEAQVKTQFEAQMQAQLEAQEKALQAQFEAQFEALVRMIEAQQKVNLFLTGRLDEMERARAEEYAETEILRQETDDLRQETSDLRHEVRDLRNGVAALTRQIEAAGMTPSWLPPPVKSPREAQVVRQDTRSLMEFIEGHFNLTELADLADQLGVDIENVAGDDKEARVRELVGYMKRRKRLKELREVVRSLRPGGDV